MRSIVDLIRLLPFRHHSVPLSVESPIKKHVDRMNELKITIANKPLDMCLAVQMSPENSIQYVLNGALFNSTPGR
jgi:hypothetical protein